MVEVLAVQHGEALDDVSITVDGVDAVVTRIALARDGGTIAYSTDLGSLVLPHRIGDPDRTPRWQGQPVVPEEG